MASTSDSANLTSTKVGDTSGSDAGVARLALPMLYHCFLAKMLAPWSVVCDEGTRFDQTREEALWREQWFKRLRSGLAEPSVRSREKARLPVSGMPCISPPTTRS